MIAPDDPRNLQIADMDIDAAQGELALIWDHLMECGWTLVSYPFVCLDEVETHYTAVDSCDHALPRGHDHPSEVIERVATAQMLRDPDQAAELGQILIDAGWRRELIGDQLTLTLDQPSNVREGLMLMLDPDANLAGGKRWSDYPDNLNALIPGHPTARAMIEVLATRVIPDAPLPAVRRAAGLQVHGGSMGECVIEAIRRIEELTWT